MQQNRSKNGVAYRSRHTVCRVMRQTTDTEGRTFRPKNLRSLMSRSELRLSSSCDKAHHRQRHGGRGRDIERETGLGQTADGC